MNKSQERQDKTGRAFKGSQRQIQTYVNEYPEILTEEVLQVLPSLTAQQPTIRWVSPLKSEQYVEYHDQGFLTVVKLPELSDKLRRFWPTPGAHWDALATVGFDANPDRTGVILVEAKSYRLEIFGNGCCATEPGRSQIRRSLAETRSWLGVADDTEDWKWMGPLYQYANRLAHLCCLREAGIPAWLVNIYFVHDESERPASCSEWQELLAEAKDELGLTGIDLLKFGATDLFLEPKRGIINP